MEVSQILDFDSGDLRSRIVGILSGQKEVGFQMVQILNGI